MMYIYLRVKAYKLLLYLIVINGCSHNYIMRKCERFLHMIDSKIESSFDLK